MEVTARDVLLRAAELMSEAEECIVGWMARDAQGKDLHDPNEGEAVGFCRVGAIEWASHELYGTIYGSAHREARTLLERYCEREYGNPSASEINDEMFPGDKEQAVLDLKGAASFS